MNPAPATSAPLAPKAVQNGTPKKEEKKKLKLATVWTEASDLLARNKGRLGIGFVLLMLNRAASLVLPASSKYLIDDVVVKHKAEMLWPIAIAAAGAAFIQALTSFSLAQLLGIAAQRSLNELRKEVHAHMVRLPIRYFDANQSGSLISRIMTDAEGVRNLIGTGIVQLIGGLVTAAVALGWLFYLNWTLTLIILLVLSVFGGAMAFFFIKMRPKFRERGKINAEVTGRLGETLGGIRVVKAYGAEEREKKVFSDGADRIYNNVKGTMTAVSGMTALATLIIGVIGMVLIVVGGGAMMRGEMTQGEFFLYIFLTGMVTVPIIEIAAIGTQITEAFAGLDRIREVKKMATENEDDANKEPCKELKGDVAFKNVWFEYNPDHPVLKNIEFTAPAGTTTALVGSSGSGKSTLISLVMAFNRPKTGMITIDGRDQMNLKLADFRAHLGVVLQDNFLFDGTVADNIGFAKPGATLDDIRRVGKLARCDEFVMGFENGYETVVGERGVRLSGGQRQRIAIARALLADPKLLILDEATSSLDSESERHIQEGLASLRQGRTTFVIAHRLSTIQSADQILVLEQGEIIERGTHKELLEKNGRYKHLYDQQYRFESERFVNPGEELKGEEKKKPVAAVK